MSVSYGWGLHSLGDWLRSCLREDSLWTHWTFLVYFFILVLPPHPLRNFFKLPSVQEKHDRMRSGQSEGNSSYCDGMKCQRVSLKNRFLWLPSGPDNMISFLFIYFQNNFPYIWSSFLLARELINDHFLWPARAVSLFQNIMLFLMLITDYCLCHH